MVCFIRFVGTWSATLCERISSPAPRTGVGTAFIVGSLEAWYGATEIATFRLATSPSPWLDRSCEHPTDGRRVGSPPSRRSTWLSLWRRDLVHYDGPATQPGEHASPSRQTKETKQRFLTPGLEQSDFTSVQRRIQSLDEAVNGSLPTDEMVSRDRFLAPLAINERQEQHGTCPHRQGHRCSDKGFLAIGLRDYLELLDWTARQTAAGNRGVTPTNVPAIFVSTDVVAGHLVRTGAELRASVSPRGGAPAADRYGAESPNTSPLPRHQRRPLAVPRPKQGLADLDSAILPTSHPGRRASPSLCGHWSPFSEFGQTN